MAKHLLLGVSLHHLTGSSKIIMIINRFGHCSSCSQILELETAMANQTQHRDSVLRFNISVTSNVISHFCWDNFDMLEETPGCATTHSMHGILIQEVLPDHQYAVEETFQQHTKTRSSPQW